MHMRPTDALAIVEILSAENQGQPLTPARLGGRISMTSGATTLLLNRLEDAGHITRTRGHADRRIVTLHSAKHMHVEAEAFFGPERQRILAGMVSFEEAELQVIRRFTSGLRADPNVAGAVGEPVSEAGTRS
ncbi:MarR family transcriptional regulator [Curtobacterium sp. TC1]|uniref:MarR family transcriptional regulator n=1 Tax=Curtobacterium sp. TC1 TaxID=2862880 RepID=UPI001C9B81F1|nr:MarR family transcriptional regulator [Curtobacterium sp. TC1]QZQ56216.1 MarR family transcriptional regulator [Curtobacterium sp. TC1]